jgi:magnesium-transporting ATPase (P-type)
MVWHGNERRNKSDFWLLSSRILAIGGWLLFIVALLVSFYAAPEIEYGFVRFRGIEVRKVWQPQLTSYLFAILWFNAIASVVAIVINRYRTRRNSDINPNFNLILLLLISIAWAVYIYFDIR